MEEVAFEVLGAILDRADDPRADDAKVGAVVAAVVDCEPDVDGGDGEEDAGEGEAGKLVDELDADEHDGAHDDEEDGAIHPEVVELDKVVGDVRAEEAHGRPDEICLSE